MRPIRQRNPRCPRYNRNMIKVGVFDSGIGGMSVAQAIDNALTDIEVAIFKNDNEQCAIWQP